MVATRIKREDAERQAALLVQKSLAAHLPGCSIATGKNLLYKIVVAPSGEVSHGNGDAPTRGQYAFQTDILIAQEAVPLVVIEQSNVVQLPRCAALFSQGGQTQSDPQLATALWWLALRHWDGGFRPHNEGGDFAWRSPMLRRSKPVSFL